MASKVVPLYGWWPGTPPLPIGTTIASTAMGSMPPIEDRAGGGGHNEHGHPSRPDLYAP